MNRPDFPLIHNLKLQRREVVELLRQVRPVEFGTPESWTVLTALQVRLLFLLRVEDDLLIRTLDLEARHHPELARLMRQWNRELRDCAPRALDFFQHWLTPGATGRDPEGEWHSLRALVEQRLAVSATLLYPAYANLAGEEATDPGGWSPEATVTVPRPSRPSGC